MEGSNCFTLIRQELAMPVFHQGSSILDDCIYSYIKHNNLLNIGLSKFLSEDMAYELKFTIHDALNNNSGFRRTVTANAIQEVRTDVLHRFAML